MEKEGQRLNEGFQKGTRDFVQAKVARNKLQEAEIRGAKPGLAYTAVNLYYLIRWSVNNSTWQHANNAGFLACSDGDYFFPKQIVCDLHNQQKR